MPKLIMSVDQPSIFVSETTLGNVTLTMGVSLSGLHLDGFVWPLQDHT